MIKTILLWVAMTLAIALLALTFVNASWLAGTPPGGLQLIAHGGAGQPVDRSADCPAAHARPSDHVFLENTIPGFAQAFAHGADWIATDVAQTKDGVLILFGDDTLDCRTDGTGPVNEATTAEIARLDAGYRYTADGGESFPLRGKGIGLIPTVSDLARQMRGKRFLFHIASDDPETADKLIDALTDPGLDIADFYGFYGSPEPIARIRKLVPDAWAFTTDEMRACTQDYMHWGWTSRVPESCEHGTIAIPLNRQFFLWGLPNRLAARMAGANARMIVFGPGLEGDPPTGITDAEQLTRVPMSYTGAIWIEDIWNIGPALRD